MKIFIDGRYYSERAAKISVFDHGLLYGDGVFEGIRAYNGRVFKLKEHIDRLFQSAKAILLDIPASPAQIMRATIDACRKNKIRDGYIRLLVTRGVGSLGLNPSGCKKPSIIIIADKIQLYPPELYAHGMDIVTVPTTRNLHSALNPAIKSLNYLNNILAKIEAADAGVPEAVLLNGLGNVAECTGDNIFIIRLGKVQTPPTADGILEGITRQVMFDLCQKLSISCIEKSLQRHDLYIADECFLTGTAAEVVAVTRIDGRPIGAGTPGPITRRLMEAFHKHVRSISA